MVWARIFRRASAQKTNYLADLDRMRAMSRSNRSCSLLCDHIIYHGLSGYIGECRALQRNGNRNRLGKQQQELQSISNTFVHQALYWLGAEREVELKLHIVTNILNDPLTLKFSLIKQGPLEAAERIVNEIKRTYEQANVNKYYSRSN